jgi:hypothetical protein
MNVATTALSHSTTWRVQLYPHLFISSTFSDIPSTMSVASFRILPICHSKSLHHSMLYCLHVICPTNLLPSQVIPQGIKTNVLADLRCERARAQKPTTRIGGVSYMHESPITERHRTFFLVAFPEVPSKRNITSVSINLL